MYSLYSQEEDEDSDGEVADTYEDSLEPEEDDVGEPSAKRRAFTMKVSPVQLEHSCRNSSTMSLLTERCATLRVSNVHFSTLSTRFLHADCQVTSGVSGHYSVTYTGSSLVLFFTILHFCTHTVFSAVGASLLRPPV